jgi:hypothetical protein
LMEVFLSLIFEIEKNLNSAWMVFRIKINNKTEIILS